MIGLSLTLIGVLSPYILTNSSSSNCRLGYNLYRFIIWSQGDSRPYRIKFDQPYKNGQWVTIKSFYPPLVTFSEMPAQVLRFQRFEEGVATVEPLLTHTSRNPYPS